MVVHGKLEIFFHKENDEQSVAVVSGKPNPTRPASTNVLLLSFDKKGEKKKREKERETWHMAREQSASIACWAGADINGFQKTKSRKARKSGTGPALPSKAAKPTEGGSGRE